MPKAVADSVAARYWALTKPRVVALIVFTAVIGMFLATPDLPGWRPLLLGSLGIWLAAASAAAINHLLDSRIDAVMVRTAHRPLPSGTLNARQVLVFAVVLGLASMLLLGLGVNALAAGLTFASLIGYAIVYTGWLKRATPQNIVIGGLAGAAPPLLGWAAVKGWPAGTGFAGLFGPPLHYDHALLLVLIIFVWTPPHFWALAIYRRDDYARAMVPMLPVTHGVEYTRWQILFYTLLLVAATILPFASGMSGLFYLGGALVLGGVFLGYAVRLFRSSDPLFPMRVFNYSVVYLMALFAFLLADHWLLPEVAPAVPVGLTLERIG
ncbi:MAG: heme o synthase [Xanthomonadaceae bacterium]|nr:heme o synthase [Xanthomonadaceae bacterium]